MSSLNRVLSLECTDHIPSPLQSSKPKLARHSSLPPLSFYPPQGLPSLPSPTSRFLKARHGSCRHNSPLSPPSCGLKPENSPHQFASIRFTPAWFVDDKEDSGRRTIARSISSLDMQDSVVYKDLCDSVRHLQVPCRYACDVRSDGMSGSTLTRDEGELCEGEMNEKGVEPSSNDVRGRPLSLRMLKRKVTPRPQVMVSSNSSFIEQGMAMGGCSLPVASSSICEGRDSLSCEVGGPVSSAFSSLVFMMESLQQHSLRLRRVLMSEADVCLHAMMAKVHQEMQDTFLWLFQKVFSCTPKLMLLTMMLLVDFAVHSMGEHVALAVMPATGQPPTCAVGRDVTLKSTSFGRVDTSTDGSGVSVARALAKKPLLGGFVEPRLCEGGAGDGCARTLKVGGSMDEEAMCGTFADQAAMTVEDDSHGGVNDASVCRHCTVNDNEGFFEPGAGSSNGSRSEDRRMQTSMWQKAMLKGPNPRHLMTSRHMLVAPIQAPALEADDYPCFDRTDLTYQHELSRDPRNPLLLANYAQFLHVVRHDHDRAEELYKRAVKADPEDGEVMGKYASFLWVTKEDTEGADEAYKAAMAADPSNAYYAGSYAHFLWNSSAGQDDTTLAGQDDTTLAATSYQQVSTSW